MRTAADWRARLLRRMGPAVSPEIDAETMKSSLDEVRQGFARGPFNEGQMNKRWGSIWRPSRRFTLQQGWQAEPGPDGERRPKYRCIDDLKESGVNSAAEVTDQCGRHSEPGEV